MAIDPEPPPYPLWSPPIDLSRKGGWTKREARAYFDWFLGEIPVGAARARAYLGVNPEADAEQHLEQVGQRLVVLLPDPAFSMPSQQEEATLRGRRISFESGPLLTNMGSSLAIDVGLLMAELLRREMPWLDWEIVTRPRSEVSFKLPVLTGFRAMSFDPMLVGLNLGHRVLARGGGANEWRDTYRVWKADRELKPDD